MSVDAIYDNFTKPEGGVILWHKTPEEIDTETRFLVRLRLSNGDFAWSEAVLGPDHREICFDDTFYDDEGNELKAEIVGYCRGPDPNSNVAYQLGDPGEGHNAKPGEEIGG